MAVHDLIATLSPVGAPPGGGVVVVEVVEVVLVVLVEVVGLVVVVDVDVVGGGGPKHWFTLRYLSLHENTFDGALDASQPEGLMAA